MKKTSPVISSPSLIDLPDINVWLALVNGRNANYARACRYWDEERSDEIAFCRITMMGLLKLATHPKVMGKDVFSHGEAWQMYQTFLELPDITFLAEPTKIEKGFASLTSTPATPHHLWTDAYLAAFALAHPCRIVSFDADFRRFPGLDFLHLAS